MRRLLLVCMLLFGSAQAYATTLKPLQAVDLVDQSELIFTGKAIDRQVATTKDGKHPYTFITFEVERVLKGSVEGPTLTLRFEGGEIGDEYLLVEGMPEFERGGHYLLFVADNGRAISPIVGWTQGKLEFLEHPSQPGASVLVDRRGMAIEGVGNGKFMRSEVRRDGQSVVRSKRSSGIQVLEEDNVVITDPLAENQAFEKGRELTPASVVLNSLSRMVEQRAGNKSFRAGATVQSLGIDDVPETFKLRPVAAAEQ